MAETILSVRNLSKSYQSAGHQLTVLDNINFDVESGSTMAILGPSGSGKTTLLGLCAGLDQASRGEIELAGFRLDQLSENELAAIRNRYIGFIFQNFQLMPTLTALENVMVPLELRGDKSTSRVARDLLEKVGLRDRMDHYPVQLSGGEQQRVSLARAFSSTPKILFADEPTGNLDVETSSRVIDLLFELNRQAGTTLVIVTHDLDLAERTDRIIKLRGGLLVADY